MSNIIDRRKNPSNKSGKNRQRYIKRVEGQIKKSLPNVINKEDIKSITDKKGKIKVPIKGVKEPSFSHDQKTGDKGYIRPGNDQFKKGDKIEKPKGGGQGGNGNGSGRGANKDADDYEDSVVVELTKEEFLKYFFADLELPDMVKKFLESNVDFKRKRAGFTTQGIPARLNKEQSLKNSIGRRIAMGATLKKKLERLKEKLANAKTQAEKDTIQKNIDKLERRLKTIPFIDELDLRYNNFVVQPVPTTKAVMFCLMDVSGSMGYEERDIAKRFFMLLYLFLTKEYEEIDLVFIRHTVTAKEVSEEEFFTGRETGGTRVASCLELMDKIVTERYNDGKWNIYGCQASDGDIWGGEDADECYAYLNNKILDKCQYFSYIEIDRWGRHDNDDRGLWATYRYLSTKKKNFVCRKVKNLTEIWPTFKGLFQKKEKKDD